MRRPLWFYCSFFFFLKYLQKNTWPFKDGDSYFREVLGNGGCFKWLGIKHQFFLVNFGYFSKAEQAQHDPKIPSIGKEYVLNLFHQSLLRI